jgi:HAD superfamily hydrolase (TIGR01509 family)
VNVTFEAPAIKALIFDLDGLLIDSEPLGYLTGQALLKQHGCVREWEPEFLHSLLGRRLSEIMLALSQVCGIAVPVADLVRDFEALRITMMRGQLRPFPGAEEFIAYARALGLRVALATSGRRAYVDAALAEVNLAGRFDVEVTGEEVVHGKPAPDVYLLAAARIDVMPQHCVVFEDTPVGIAAAVAAGMRAVAVPNDATRGAVFETAPHISLPDLHAAIPWLIAQEVGSDRVALARFGRSH